MEGISDCIESGRYLDTYHSQFRQRDRAITRSEILFVLKNGYHESRKDRFEARYQQWNYAVRGKTLDNKDLRVIVSFAIDGLLIITAINLGR